MIFIFPFPPSVNTLYFQAPGQGHGKKILTKKGREYKQRLLNLYAEDYSPTEDNLKLKIFLYFPTVREGDVDNYIKPIQDGLKWLGVLEDDKQIKSVTCTSAGKSLKFNRGVAVIILTYIDKGAILRPYSESDLEKVMQEHRFDAECMAEFIKPTKKNSGKGGKK